MRARLVAVLAVLALVVALAFAAKAAIKLYGLPFGLSGPGLIKQNTALQLQHDSTLIKLGQAERDVGDWRARFGVMQQELQSAGELADDLKRRNLTLRQQLGVTVRARDTLYLPALDDTLTTDSTWHFTGQSKGLVFDALVNTIQRTLFLDWQLELQVDVSIAENKQGRPDVYVRVPTLSNVAIGIRQYDYVPRKESFWERIQLGVIGSASLTGGRFGALGCYTKFCAYGGIGTEGLEVGGAYIARPFK